MRLSRHLQTHTLLLAPCGALFALLIILSSCATYRTALEAEYFGRGKEAFAAQNYSEALGFFKKAQEVSLNNSAQYRIAELYILLEQYEDARNLIDLLMRMDSKNLLARELDALWYARQANNLEYREAATSRYDALLAEDALMNGRIYANAGIFYLNIGDGKKARDLFEKAADAGLASKEMALANVQALTAGAGNTASPAAAGQQGGPSNSAPAPASSAANTAAEKPASGEPAFAQTQAMNRAVAMLLSLRDEGALSDEEVFGAAGKFKDAQFYPQAFALYAALAKPGEGGQDGAGDAPLAATSPAAENAADAASQEIRLQAYAEMVFLIARKRYAPASEDIPGAVLSYVETILQSLTEPDSALRRDLAPSLAEIAGDPALTEVLKKRITELYARYGVDKDVAASQAADTDTAAPASASSNSPKNKTENQTDNSPETKKDEKPAGEKPVKPAADESSAKPAPAQKTDEAPAKTAPYNQL